MDISQRVRFLQQVNIFSESPENLLSQISEKLVEMEVATGNHIVLKGDLGDSMYILIQGRAKVHDGNHVFSILKKGDVFGKYYLIDKKERSATVTALEQTKLFCFRQELFYEITRNDSTIVKGILKALVGRLRDMNLAEEQMVAQNQEILLQKNELEKQKKELLELNATKDKFFSIIAHDLRSPISTLISLSEVLKMDMDALEPEQQREILNSLHNLSMNYLKLLDNLLQWANMQSGRLNPEPVTFSLHNLMLEVADFYKPNALSKNITIEVVDSIEIKGYADKNMIRTVLRNLVSNAIKYTMGGGKVSLTLHDRGSRAEVGVIDSGIGMSPEKLATLFHLDKAHSAKGTANEPGTGLGLILCKEFVEKNGGNFTVLSEPGSGSTFIFTLPKS